MLLGWNCTCLQSIGRPGKFLFPHGSLPKVWLRIGSEALAKWSFKLSPSQNLQIETLWNTFWCSLSGASRICDSFKIVLVFWNAGQYAMFKVSLFSSGWLRSFSNNSFLGIFCAFNISFLKNVSLYPYPCNQCSNSLHFLSKRRY